MHRRLGERQIGGALGKGIVVESVVAVDRHASPTQFRQQGRRDGGRIGHFAVVEDFGDVVVDGRSSFVSGQNSAAVRRPLA